MRTATTPADLDEVRRLFRAFLAWHRERHVDDLDLIDTYFDDRAFEQELSDLPGKYAPPDGSLLLARVAGAGVGCVAARRLDDQTCEMKRMFVEPRARGRGVARALSESLIEGAREAGYATMFLDTSVRQAEARSLYASLGFEEVASYYEVPDDVRDWLVFYRLDL